MPHVGCEVGEALDEGSEEVGVGEVVGDGEGDGEGDGDDHGKLDDWELETMAEGLIEDSETNMDDEEASEEVEELDIGVAELKASERKLLTE